MMMGGAPEGARVAHEESQICMDHDDGWRRSGNGERRMGNGDGEMLGMRRRTEGRFLFHRALTGEAGRF
jgi:hypothetical protein